jgi:hypothetical protein
MKWVLQKLIKKLCGGVCVSEILRFIAETFDLNVLALFLIASFFLLYFDSKEYKKNDLKKEYKFSRFFGFFFIGFGIVMYIIARNIRL